MMGEQYFVGKNKVRLRWILLVVTSVILIIMMYKLNYYTPLYADDYSYAYSFASGERIRTIPQIIDSQISHFQVQNGRCVTHALAQFLLLIGGKKTDILNAVFFVVLIYLMSYHAYGKERIFPSTIVSFAALVFLSAPAFGQSFLWTTGAANYLYGVLIVLGTLLPYKAQAKKKNQLKKSFIYEAVTAVGYFAVGIIAGWTNENTSVAMIVMMILYIAYFALERIKIHAWNITGVLGGIAGCVLMLTAPGTTNRLASAGGSGSIVAWIKRAVFYTCDMLTNLHLIFILLILIAGIYVYQKNLDKKKSVNGAILLTLIYLMGFLASVYSMIVSPQFPKRAWSGPTVLAVILLGNASTLIEYKSNLMKNAGKIVVAFLIMLGLANYINAFYELKNVNSGYLERVSIIEKALVQGERSVELPVICGWSGYSCYGAAGDLSGDSDVWPNTAIARYYQLDEVIKAD